MSIKMRVVIWEATLVRFKAYLCRMSIFKSK